MSARCRSVCLFASFVLLPQSSALLIARTPPLFRKSIRLYQLPSNTGNTATMMTTMAAATTTTTTPPTDDEMALSPPPLPSKIQTTLDPCVVLMKELISKFADRWEGDEKGGIYSLAQGVVYWQPPAACKTALIAALNNNDDDTNNNDLHLYGPNEGLIELRRALQHKLATRNGLTTQYIMVTAGANQAYSNCVLTLLDNTKDRAVVFAPYYFNHVMALQMTIGNENILVGPTDSTSGEPDLDWLENAFLQQQQQQQENRPIRMVTLTNPNNPTGTALSRSFCQRLVELTKRHGCWLVFDCTYEDFTFSDNDDDDTEGSPSSSSSGCCFDGQDHCIHIFSFSKAYALAGYRCGYLTLPTPRVYDAMMKVQDTVPIAPSRIAQIAALAALSQEDDGREWVRQKIDSLQMGRAAILEALACLPQIMGPCNGAMYVMGRLPYNNTTGTTPIAADDVKICERLVRDYGVAVIPGSFCGAKGWIRVCYANLPPERCTIAARRLADGLRAIVQEAEATTTTR